MEEKEKAQINALFLPFMQMTTGHHNVADALIEELQRSNDNFVCEKVDILSYSYGSLEKVVTAIYVAWIKLLPNIYDTVYKKSAYRHGWKKKRYYTYELLFIPFIKKLIQTKKPHIIFCTHAFPSYLLSVLKRKKMIKSIVVNVYTDFFVNNVWGMKGIDYHFVPSNKVKKNLIKKGVNEETVFVTGIPVHPILKYNERKNQSKIKPDTILVTGGSLGIGPIKKLLLNATNFHIYVLCGNNDALYTYLKRKEKSNITPYRYINSRKQMNELYDKVDAVLTKPGGVTISECIKKRKPIFIYTFLPGQERINMKELERLGLLIPVRSNAKMMERQIATYFMNDYKQQSYMNNTNQYRNSLERINMSHFTKNVIGK